MEDEHLIEEIKKIPSEKINRKHFYWVAIPFTEKRPLQVFTNLKNEVHLGGKHAESKNVFSGHVNKFGKRTSDVIEIIIRHKRRLALLVQNDEYNKRENYNFVYVVPITTFDSNNEKLKYFKEHPDITHYHYIGNCTGSEAVANIGDIKRIDKSLLLETTNYPPLSDDLMKIICKKISTMMEIEEIEKCDDCIYNYKNYIQSLDSAVGNEND